MEVLLEHDAQVDLQDDVRNYLRQVIVALVSWNESSLQFGSSALFWASHYGHTAAVEVLLNYNAQVDLPTMVVAL